MFYTLNLHNIISQLYLNKTMEESMNVIFETS